MGVGWSGWLRDGVALGVGWFRWVWFDFWFCDFGSLLWFCDSLICDFVVCDFSGSGSWFCDLIDGLLGLCCDLILTKFLPWWWLWLEVMSLKSSGHGGLKGELSLRGRAQRDEKGLRAEDQREEEGSRIAGLRKRETQRDTEEE